MNIPDPDGLIERSRYNEIRLWVVVDTENIVCVSSQDLGCPSLHDSIDAAKEYKDQRIGIEHRDPFFFVCFPAPVVTYGLQVPDTNCFVIRGRAE